MTLNTPTWTAYTGPGFDGTVTSYSSWSWNRDIDDGNKYLFYRDARFETTLGGTKQAFALSFGDIHGAIGVPTTSGNNSSLLLVFSQTNNRDYFFRSPGRVFSGTSGVFSDVLSSSGSVNAPSAIRPSLYLSVD